MTDEEVIARLHDISGQVYDQPELLAEWSRDWWPYGAKIPLWDDDLPLVAIAPDSVEDVAAVVRLAAETGRPIMVKGGGSGLNGSLYPEPGAILIETSGLNMIGELDQERRTIEVEAGVHGGELEERLNELGYWLPLQPRSLNLATIGGMIATRASGLLSTKYGDIGGHIEAIEAVLADGTIVRYDGRISPEQRDRLIGSAGALGIITSATLRVRPTPAEFRLRVFDVQTISCGLRVVGRLMREGVIPAVAAVYDAAESAWLSERLAIAGESLLVLGFDGEPDAVHREEAVATKLVTSEAGSSFPPDVAREWWDRRHATDWLIDGNDEEGWIADVFHCSANWSETEEAIDSVRRALEPVTDDCWVHVESCSIDGTHLSFPFFIRERTDDRAMERYRRAVDAADSAARAAGARPAWRRRGTEEGQRASANDRGAATERTHASGDRFAGGGSVGE
ncbi:MAG: FAD-binding oxidoreductase [Thermomicrobiales bacterium]|nr:FAD-binding oxidoreductase [Thermomicrobiales bacterium]